MSFFCAMNYNSAFRTLDNVFMEIGQVSTFILELLSSVQNQ